MRVLVFYLLTTVTSSYIHSVARLVLESDNLGGRIKIRGENTNRYLCINKKGDLVTRVRLLFS